MDKLDLTIAASPPSIRPGRSGVARFLAKHRLLVFSVAVVLALIAIAVLAPMLTPNAPDDIVGRRLQRPSGEHWFGTDALGRDIYSRVIYGSRLSLRVALVGGLIGTSLGALIGGLSGFLGGKIDLLVQRIVDVFQAFPLIILALAIIAALGSSFHTLILAVLIAFFPTSARVIRSASLTAVQREFVTAARATGAGAPRIFLLHVLPQAIAPFTVLLSLNMGLAITLETSLSFIGLGPPPPAVSWGGMMSGATLRYAQVAPWMLIAPGMAISLAVYAFNLLGDSLNDMFKATTLG